MKYNTLKKNLLVASISTLMLTGLTACGDDNKARDCNGQSQIGCGGSSTPSEPSEPSEPKSPESPKAVADSVTTKFNTSITIDVIANDTDANNDLDATTLKLVDMIDNQLVDRIEDSTQGVWEVESGKIKFTPAATLENKIVSVKYSIDDKDASTSAATAIVSVTVGKSTAPVDSFDWSDAPRDEANIVTMSPANSIGWTATDGDERAIDLTINGDRAIVATYWHNNAHSFKLTDNVATLEADFDFARTPGDRDDVVSGASEQLLYEVASNKDANLLVGRVIERNDINFRDVGDGLYVTKADASGSFQPVQTATTNSSNYYAYKNMTGVSINNSNQNIAIANKSGEIKILSSDLANTVVTKKVDFEVNSLAFSDDGKQLFVSGKKSKSIFSSEGVVVMLDVDNNLSEAWRWKTANTLKQLVSLGNDKVLVRPDSGENVYVLGDATGTEPKVKTIAIAGSSRDIAISPDNRLIVVSQLKQAEVINLKTNKRSAIDIEAGVGAVGLSGTGANQYLWVATRDRGNGKLNSYTIPSEVLN